MNFKTFFTAGKAKIVAVSAGFLIAITGIIYLTGSGKEKNKGVNPAFKAYISAYTGGVISRETPVMIRFISEISKPEDHNIALDKKLFSFSPSIKGTTMWVDNNTIQFRPEEPLSPGTVFNGSFSIGEIMEIPSELKVFEFSFETLPLTLDVSIEGLRTYDVKNLSYEKLHGTLTVSDVTDIEAAEKVLTASQNGKNLKISWEHEKDRRTHYFRIDSIERKDTKEKVDISWDGSHVKAETKGSTSYEVPALGEFILTSWKAVQGEEQYLELQFSDPLLPGQNLNGLITIAGVPDLRIVQDENIIKAYPPVRQIGVKTVIVNEGIKNVNNKKFTKSQTLEITFEEIKPAVRLVGKGVILPGTDGLIFPFEAVSLRSVNVKITRIFENNITQFFQVNNFDGSSELRRVGKTVYNKTVILQNTSANDYGRWKRYSLDLSNLIKAELGAIYQVKIGFKKKDSYYSCPGSEAMQESGMIENESEEENEDYDSYEGSYWDYSDDYYYSYNYDWRQRENPCHDSYYGDYRSVKRNVFASDLGVIAKIGTSGNMLFAVTDMKSTKPVTAASVEIYDYQQQLLKEEKTNSNGIVTIELKKKPFFLIVKKDNQIGYLRLDNSTVLPVSNFDVSGTKVQKGIKGFLYGERGVWRPGDSLFLTFILEDKLNTLPKNQPVSFELVNPMGQITKRLVSASPVKGFYNFSTNTEDSDPTGNWTARVKVGGAEFNYPIKIETVMPNRLKIKIDFGKERLSAKNNTLTGTLEVKWLHGAVARNLNADIDMQLVKATTNFPKYTEYVFDDPGKNFEPESSQIFNSKIDENGKAKITSKISTQRNAPGMLTANFKVKVMEEGGAFSTDRFSIPYYPYEVFAGIRLPKGDKARNMLLTDTNHVVEIVSVDPDGNPVGNREIEVAVYKVNWRWWWDRTDDNLQAFLENYYRQPFHTQTITTSADGKGKYTLRINYPEWGRFYIRATDKKSKHSTGKTMYVDWPGWAGKSREKNQGGTTVLAFTADKETYKTGENVTISIPGAANGRALVSVESGSKVIETYWVETKEGKTDFTFKATEEMTPNVFINVTLIQPHAQTKNDLPIRMYGIVPIRVEDPQTILKPVLTMKNELKPEETVSLSVKEENGKAMTYTVAIVDEGLLDLTRFKTPDPWNNFYAREALGVNTWDMYDFVIGAFTEKTDKLLAIGGDGEVKGSEKNKANRFKPVVIFLGPFRLEAGKTATHTFTMPQYVGSVRTMVVAGDPSGAYGNTEKTTPVRKPLMLLATLPRVVGPDEYVTLPVNVFAMKENVKNVSIEVRVNNMFEILDGGQKNMSFSQPGDEIVNFNLKVKSATGTGKVSVVATSGNEKAIHEISIEVRNPNNPQTKVSDFVIEAGQEWSTSYQPFGTAGTNEVVLEVSTIPPVNLGDRLKYLIQYPYGCVEQTTSSVFPQLYVRDFVDNPEMVKRIDENIKSGIQRLRRFQLPEGGLTYWPGNNGYDVCDWGTTYAGHFMIEAEKKGYSLPTGFLSAWKQYQKKLARNWTGSTNKNGYYSNNDLDQAYRLYTLALANEPETGAMNRLKEKSDLSIAAKWKLAAAYHLAGQTEVARNLIKNVSVRIQPYREHDYTFGSHLRDKAMIMEVMIMLNMKSEATVLAKEISEELSSNRWLSTSEISSCLKAMGMYSNVGSAGAKVNFTYSLNGNKPVNAITDMKIAQVNLKSGNDAGTLKVKNNSTGVLYARLILTGTPSAGKEEAASNNLTVSADYKRKDGRSIGVEKIEQGTDFMVEVTVHNPSRNAYKNLSLKQIFPSGWEIHNSRLDNFVEPKRTVKRAVNSYYDEETGEEYYEEEEEEEDNYEIINFAKTSAPTYQDIRDDRVYTFFDLRAGETKTFRIMLNAAYLGRFYLPAVYAEAMYDGKINALQPGKWVEVVQAGMKTVAK
jgi:uncharacterized protein YfaS (alpha-2-macroglobulin family)